MSVSNPAFFKIASSAGRSPGSQRVPESESGRITQARLLVAACEAEIPVIATAVAAIATRATFTVFFIYELPFIMSDGARNPRAD
jgi:hypothetical protein